MTSCICSRFFIFSSLVLYVPYDYYIIIYPKILNFIKTWFWKRMFAVVSPFVRTQVEHRFAHYWMPYCFVFFTAQAEVIK